MMIYITSNKIKDKDKREMEKIIIKPAIQEINLKSKPEDGHTDVFSYNHSGSDPNGLGSLFIIGHVQPAGDETSYMVNLVASLAKREYYSKPDILPKEAFSKALKKINEVLEDFFKNKDLRINIGVFAIAGENIFISRLGKFKIILARGKENIDILNNITLFTKEHIQEKEFSNIISGRIEPNDKIFAFYPNRALTAREKALKIQLAGATAEKFISGLNSIKESNETFSCAGLHLTIIKHIEPAIIERPQPQELKEPKLILTKAKIKNPEPVISLDSQTTIAQPKPKTVTANTNSEPQKPDPEILKIEKTDKEARIAPLIIPSEFSSATKDNVVLASFKKLISPGLRIKRFGRNNPGIKLKKGLIWIGSVVVLFTISGWFLSWPFAITPSPQDKESKRLIEQAQNNIEIAKLEIQNNKLLEARKLLRVNHASINSIEKKTEKVEEIKNNLSGLLDSIDKTVDGTPVLIYQIPTDSGQGRLIASAKGKILITAASDVSRVLVVSGSDLENNLPFSNLQPAFLFGTSDSAVMIDDSNNNIAFLPLVTGESIKSEPLTASPIDLSQYENNLYMLTLNSVLKINDALKGSAKTITWLNQNSTLPVNPLLIAVDGKIFILNDSGILSTYYKGEKISESATEIPIDTNNKLLATKDSSSLYLVDNALARIHVLDKLSGSLIKTVKLNSNQPIIASTISGEGIIYFLTADNKIWQIIP